VTGDTLAEWQRALLMDIQRTAITVDRKRLARDRLRHGDAYHVARLIGAN
jgi:hypothetical protein